MMGGLVVDNDSDDDSHCDATDGISLMTQQSGQIQMAMA